MTAKAKPRLGRRIFRAIAVLAAVGAIAMILLFCALWIEHRRGLTLPNPTGQFAVGRVIYDWTDDGTVDTLAPIPGTKRELLVWIWYPAQPQQSPLTSEYVPAALAAAVERDSGVLLGKFLTRDRSKVQAHSLQGAQLAPEQPSYPVLIMRAGASAEVWSYSTLAEDLASHGYVVVGFDAPYRTHEVVFPDGRVITRMPNNDPERCVELSGEAQTDCTNRLISAWTGDMSFVLDRLQHLNASDPDGKFTGRLDLTRVGAFGHSFGGAAAFRFCHDDPRCKAGIDLDGALHGRAIQSGITRPFMFVLSDHSGEHDPDGARILAEMRWVYDRLPSDSGAFIEIKGANHFFFSDDGALLKSHIVVGALRKLGIVRINGPRQLQVTAYCLRTFFDAYLRCISGAGAPKAPPTLQSSLYPEVQVVN